MMASNKNSLLGATKKCFAFLVQKIQGIFVILALKGEALRSSLCTRVFGTENFALKSGALNPAKFSCKQSIAMVIILGMALPLITLLYSLENPTITGKASSGVVNFCFMDRSISISAFSPSGNGIINGTITLSAALSNVSGISALNLTFTYLNDSVTQVIGTDAFDGDALFSTSWNTATVSDGNYNYRVRFSATSNETACAAIDTETSGLLTIDNDFVAPFATRSQQISRPLQDGQISRK